MLTAIVMAAIVVAWLGCGVISAGYTFAYFQRKYPRLAEDGFKDDRSIALLDIGFGPIALFNNISGGYCKYGWLYWGRRK